MAVNLMQLVAKVTADTQAAEMGLAGFSRFASGAGAGAALGLAAVGVAAAGIGIASTKMAGDFQQNMTTLVTGAGESKDNIKLVSDGILQLARDTGTSTKQLSDGMFMIESAGYHGADGLNVLKVAAEGAKVGNADLGTTSDALTTILKDYPDVTNGASGAMNTLIATVANGKTHMQDLAGSLAEILPTSSAAGVGLNDVMGAMATMTGEGVPAANAATYLRQTILALNAPSSQAKKALEDVGLTTDQVSAAMKQSLPDALKMITDHIGNKFPKGSAEYLASLKDIVGGSKEIQGVLDLTGNHMADFEANTGKVSDAVKAGGKQITGWSDVQGDFNTKVGRAKEVVETLMIQLGTKLLPVAGQVVDAFATHLVPALKDIKEKGEAVIGAIQGVIKFFQDTGPAATAVKVVLAILAGAMLGFAASAIPALVTSLIASVTAFGAQAVAAGAAAIATMAAALPFILVGAAIAAVIAIVILAVTHWKQITEALGHFKDMLGNVMGAIGEFIGNVLGAIGGFFGGIFGHIGEFFGNVFKAIGDFFGNAVQTIKDWGGKLIELYTWPYRTAWDLITGAVKWLGDFLRNAWNTIVTDVGNVLGGIGGIIGNIWSGIVGLVKGGINLVIGDINTMIRLLDSIQIHIPAVGVGPVHTPAFDWGGLGIAQIPYLAQGGDVGPGGAAIVGDAGPELLSVGSRGARVTPLLGGLSGGGPVAASGPQTIVVQLVVDGRRLAEVTVPHMPTVLRNATGVRAF